MTAEVTCSPVTAEYSVPGDTWRLHWAPLFCFQVECRIRPCLAAAPFSPGLLSCQAEALVSHTHLPWPSTLLSQPRCSLTAEPESPRQE